MKKLLIAVAVLTGIAFLAKRFAPDLAKIDWEKKFEAMPDNAPPKWMFTNIGAIRDNTERIIELLERSGGTSWSRTGSDRRNNAMKVLTVFAHNDRHSFCGGVLERFSGGLADAGHTNEVLDLYAIKFDPVFRDQDVASYTSGEIPTDILELMDLEQRVLRSCRGPLQRFLASRAMRGKSQSEIAAMIRNQCPRTSSPSRRRSRTPTRSRSLPRSISVASRRSSKVGSTVSSPSTSRSASPPKAGVATSTDGYPLLQHQRALIMTSTIFDEHAYDDGIRDAIAKVIDDWGFRYPGIDDVEHVYFYAATAAPPETINAYLDQAYQLGKDFGLPRVARATLTTKST